MVRRHEKQNGEISSVTSAKEESMEPFSKSGVVKNSAFVNLRDKPTKNGRVLGTVKRGERLEILNKINDEYYKIRYSGTVAYIPCFYCEERR